MEFWNDPGSPILTVHWVDLLTNPSAEEFLERVESYVKRREKEEKLPDLSCVGYKEFNNVPWKTESGWNETQVKKIAIKSPVGLLFHKRNINWASYADAWTEYISSAGKEELKYYQNSALPKRPSAPVSPYFLVIGPEDLDFGNMLTEVIISYYEWDTALVVTCYCDDIGVNVDDVVKIFEKNNLKYTIK